MYLNTFTDKKLRLLDQIGELPIIKKNMPIISAVEIHALSLDEPHRSYFLRALEKENSKVKMRIDKKIEEIELEREEEQIKKREKDKKQRESQEEEFCKSYPIKTVLKMVKKIYPNCYGLRVYKEFFYQEISFENAVAGYIEHLMGGRYPCSLVLPEFINLLKESKENPRGLISIKLSDDSILYLCFSQEILNKVIEKRKSDFYKVKQEFSFIGD